MGEKEKKTVGDEAEPWAELFSLLPINDRRYISQRRAKEANKKWKVATIIEDGHYYY